LKSATLPGFCCEAAAPVAVTELLLPTLAAAALLLLAAGLVGLAGGLLKSLRWRCCLNRGNLAIRLGTLRSSLRHDIRTLVLPLSPTPAAALRLAHAVGN
jgi:hypothetical protein